MIATGPGWDLHLGRWQDELADLECDAIICDPPYGARAPSAGAIRLGVVRGKASEVVPESDEAQPQMSERFAVIDYLLTLERVVWM